MAQFNGKNIFLIGLKISDSSGDPQPVLNAPILSLDVNGYINITDYRNGNFVAEYLVYVNGSYVASTTERQIAMSTYNIGTSDAVTAVAKSPLFENSDPSNSVKYLDVSNGTIGLLYSVGSEAATWAGLGSCTETDITVASLAEGKPVTAIMLPGTRMFDGNNTEMTIRLPDSITTINNGFLYNAGNKTVIFGANTSKIAATTFFSPNGTSNTLDFRRAKKVPTFGGELHPYGYPKVIVPDDLYDEWVVATNWVTLASRIIRATEYEAQQGASV